MNILFIVLDDLRPQLGCYGHKWIKSENMDRLARQGVLFENAHCQQAVCGPSRASVLSGCRPDTTKVYDIYTHLRSTMPDVLSLPQHMREQGYTTVSIGKVYHAITDDAESWSIPPVQSEALRARQDYMSDEALEVLKHRTNIEEKYRGKERPEIFGHIRSCGPAYEAGDVQDNEYLDGKNTDLAIEKLGEFKQTGAPFFLAMGYSKPHLPFNAPRRYWDLYREDALPLAENPFAPDGVTPYSLSNYEELRFYHGIPDEGGIPDDLARTLIHAYCACVSYVDAQVGRLLAELDRLGLRDDTAIVLWGDHGWKLGEHGSWSKHTNFEIDTRAPLIIHAPGMKGNGRSAEALVEFVDMYPTICDLAGIAKPAHLEGASLLPLLNRPEADFKRAVFSQFPRERHDVMGHTVRTPEFRYTEWRKNATGAVMARELYDHRHDHMENANLAEREEFRGHVADMAKILHDGWRAAAP
jgi:iduronate 2-sulfatase